MHPPIIPSSLTLQMCDELNDYVMNHNDYMIKGLRDDAQCTTL